MPDPNIPLDAEPDEADAPATDGDAESPEEPPPFQNRAARRARGKGSTQPARTTGTGQHGGGRGSVQGPRQWGNRRSG